MSTDTPPNIVLVLKGLSMIERAFNDSHSEIGKTCRLAAEIIERREQSRSALVEALERAERKLKAYVGVCKGDKELTDAVLPLIEQTLTQAREV